METTSRSTTRTVQAAALVAAPVLGLATTLAWPETPPDLRDRLAVLADAGGRLDLAHALNLLTILAFVPAVHGMLRLLPHRPRSRGVGATLTTLGLVGWSGVLALSVVEAQAARGPVTQEVVGLLERLVAAPVAAALTVMFLLGLFVGLVVLAVALRRARVVGTWVPVVVCLAVVLDMVASTVTVAVVGVWLLQCAAWGRVGLALVRAGSDAPVRGAAGRPVTA